MHPKLALTLKFFCLNQPRDKIAGVPTHLAVLLLELLLLLLHAGNSCNKNAKLLVF